MKNCIRNNISTLLYKDKIGGGNEMGDKDLFKNIEKKSGVNMNELLKLVNSIQGANFQDEKTLREIIQKVGALANRQVPKEKEDELVKTILKNGDKLNFQQIAKMMEKKKG